VLGAKQKKSSPRGKASTASTEEPVMEPPAKQCRFDSPSEILKSYGLNVDTNPAPLTIMSSQEVCSSQETVNETPRASIGQEAPPPLPADAAASSSSGGRLLGYAVQFVDASRRAMVRVLFSGERLAAPLEAGPNATAVARFGAEVVPTEVPNLALVGPIVKRPARHEPKTVEPPVPDADAAAGAAEEGDEAAEGGDAKGEPASVDAEGPAGVPPLAAPRKYCKMWYKNSHNWGIRQCFLGKKQIFSLSGVPGDEGKEQMGAVADAAIARLQGGASEHEVKEWARGEVAKLKCT